MENIIIGKGIITTLVAERRTGITTFLHKKTKEALLRGEKILIICNNIEAAMTFRSTLLAGVGNVAYINPIYLDAESARAHDLKEFDFIVYDNINIHSKPNRALMALFKEAETTVLVGITWENIAFDEEARETIQGIFTNESHNTYYITYLRDRGTQIAYDIPSRKTESL